MVTPVAILLETLMVTCSQGQRDWAVFPYFLVTVFFTNIIKYYERRHTLFQTIEYVQRQKGNELKTYLE